MNLTSTFHDILNGKDLSQQQAQDSLHAILRGDCPDTLLAALLIALRLKGESVDELTGFARQMRVHCVRIRSHHPVVLDTCGTGGDGLQTFNISTLAALVIAGCGVPVAKHGNRSISSRCGSADLLESLGARIQMPALLAQRCLNHTGFTFLFAPAFHPSLKKISEVRRTLSTRTVFNLLGPLSNPAGASAQLLGVPNEALAEKMAHVLKNLGCRRAMVVCGSDGMDEVSLAADTIVFRLEGRAIKRYRFRPEQAGFKRVRASALRGGSPDENAAIARKVLQGKPGAIKDAVILNAAFGLLACGRSRNIAAAVKLARESLESGQAQKKLHQFMHEAGTH